MTIIIIRNTPNSIGNNKGAYSRVQFLRFWVSIWYVICLTPGLGFDVQGLGYLKKFRRVDGGLL